MKKISSLKLSNVQGITGIHGLTAPLKKDRAPAAKASPKDDLLDIKKMLGYLNRAYEDLASYAKGERNRLLNMQIFIGEAVTQELLHQSYGIPDYTTEERLKRLMACVSKAVEKYHEAVEKHTDLKESECALWGTPDDPHILNIYDQIFGGIDTSNICIKEIPVKRPPAREGDISEEKSVTKVERKDGAIYIQKSK